MNEDRNLGAEVAKSMLKKKMMTIIISSLSAALPFLLIIFTLFVSVFIVLDLFEFKSEASGSGSYAGVGSYESGSFTVSNTLLTKEEFKSQLSAAVSKYSKLQTFADNADDIYDNALADGVNPELVVVRAIKEGFSPGDGYNYWGIGCTNTGEGRDCESYNDFISGVRRYVGIVSRYASLHDMMSSYSYIGDYWYSIQHYDNGGINWGIGGCAYASSIYNPIPSRVQDACSIYTLCTPNILTNCVATTEEDQFAYATWQVNEMLKIRDSIFDVKVPSYGYDGVATSSNIIMMSDADAWYLLTGYYSSVEANNYVTKSVMDSRMVTITVPIRTWSSNDPDDYSTKKSIVKMTVHRELASLYTNFFNDIYNETGSDNDLFVITSSEVGCYNYRKSTSGTRLSAHAYGAACDINWNTTGNGYGEHVYSRSEWLNLDKSKSKYQIIYDGSKVVEIARRYTLSWGGSWRSSTDAMHFSFIGDETRAVLNSRS